MKKKNLTLFNKMKNCSTEWMKWGHSSREDSIGKQRISLNSSRVNFKMKSLLMRKCKRNYPMPIMSFLIARKKSLKKPKKIITWICYCWRKVEMIPSKSLISTGKRLFGQIKLSLSWRTKSENTKLNFFSSERITQT